VSGDSSPLCKIGASRRSRLQNCGFIHDLDRFACRRSLPGGYSFRKIYLTESGASRLDSSRRPTCCTTQQRPTNIRPLWRSSGWPNTRPQVLERFVRHLQYAAGIGWLQANTFGRSSATLAHVSLLGLSRSAPGARRTSVLHPVRKTAIEPLRKLDRASSEAHRNLRVPPKNLRVLELLWEFAGSLHKLEPFGARLEPFGARRTNRSLSSADFGLPPVRYNRHRASSEAHRNLRAPPESLRDSEANPPKSPPSGDRIVSKNRLVCGKRAGLCTVSGATVVNLKATPDSRLSAESSLRILGTAKRKFGHCLQRI
jgi:hypothetical protein